MSGLAQPLPDHVTDASVPGMGIAPNADRPGVLANAVAPDDGDGRDPAPQPASEADLVDTQLPTAGTAPRRHLYPSLLRLQHVQPNAWQRAVLGEGSILAGSLLALADVATAWAVVVVPVVVAVVVKGYDQVAGQLGRRAPADPADPRDRTGSR